MDMEKRQSEAIDRFADQAAAVGASPSAVAAIVLEATSHPSMFSFSAILSFPSIAKLKGTQYATSLRMLHLFAYGTWNDYKRDTDNLPTLLPDQVCKLKQLSMLSLAETDKVLPYDQLMQKMDVPNVRELEDFLINECIYAGIVRGKLDQTNRCFTVQFAAGRDFRPEQLNSILRTLDSWLDISGILLNLVQETITWESTMRLNETKHHMEILNKNHTGYLDNRFVQALEALEKDIIPTKRQRSRR